MNKEPVLTAAGIAAITSALIALLLSFGVGLTPDQTAAIMGLVGVVAPVVAGYFARKRVTPTLEPRPRTRR